jgi:glycosidase
MADANLPLKSSLDPIGQKYRHIPKIVTDALGLYVHRDGCRTPMQWDDSQNSGFCENGVTPWLPVNPDYRFKNVQTELSDGESILHTYRRLLRLRGEMEVLQTGSIQILEGPEIDPDLLVYQRFDGDQVVLVVINFSDRAISFQNPTSCCQSLLEVGMEIQNDSETIRMPPYAAIIVGAHKRNHIG